jgi:pentatricopeptide repeat protein
MQSANKTDEFIVMEFRDYLWKHPRQRTPAIVNDILEPLARQLDYSQLVTAIVDMMSALYIDKDERTYEILLTMYVAKQDMTKAQEMFAEMCSQDVEYTPCALVAVMTMGLQLSKLDVALKAFKKLKTSWDVRSTWAVSPFALQRHKTNTLTKLVELACNKRRLMEVLPLLEDMDVPEEVVTVVSNAFTSLSEIEIAAMAKLVGDSSKFTTCLRASSKALLRSRQVDSDASTSEGSRSDSEDDVEKHLRSSCKAMPKERNNVALCPPWRRGVA